MKTSVKKTKPSGLLLGLGILLTLFVSGLLGMKYVSEQDRQAKSAAMLQQYEQESNARAATAESAKQQAAHYKAFSEKAIAITQLKPAFSPDGTAKIKGKVLIFRKMQEAFSSYDLLGFENRSNAQSQQYISQDEDAVKAYGLSFKDLAENLDELATVIQVECHNGDVVGNYGGINGGIPAYSNRCLVSVIDYKTKTIVAQETFENATPEDSIRVRKDQYSEVLMYPYEKIQDYIRQFPRLIT
jgi:hypothetical protein